MNGIWGGYQGEGETVSPFKSIRQNIRTPGAESVITKITEMLLNYFRSIAPAGVTVNALSITAANRI